MDKSVLSNFALCLIMLVLALLVHGAVPYLLTPTLGQAVWSTGFSQSFINNSVFTIYAHNIGAPEPAAIAFGLAGAWVTAVFLQFGLSAPDAYAAMVALWMSTAFFSAYCFSRHFAVNRPLSSLAALSWMLMPVAWNHAGYSMLSIGIALLSFYFLTSIKLIHHITASSVSSRETKSIWTSLYIFAAIVSVFMDGYSFMLFAVGSSILLIARFFAGKSTVKKRLLFVGYPVHVVGFGVAYVLYVLYIGKLQFSPAPIGFFRGWGADLSFIAVPTQGVHWIPDLLGWSTPRSSEKYFGDASVWTTTFSVPLIIAAIWSTFKIRARRSLVTALALVSLFGFYMSLGPSLKIQSVKPSGQDTGQIMEDIFAVAPTGSAILSENVPGFSSMRASYRWAALGVFGAWALLVLAMSACNTKKTVSITVILVCAISLLNLPSFAAHLDKKAKNRDMFLKIESELVDDLRKAVDPGERVAFLPWRNDFLLNYASSKLDIISYNIGGDKNLSQAREYWPETMKDFQMGRIDARFVDRIVMMFAKGDVDVVVLPYIDMLWAAHSWPYPIEFREDLAPIVEKLAHSQFLEVENREFYAAVRLNPKYEKLSHNELLLQMADQFCLPSYCLATTSFDSSTPTVVGVLQGDKLVSVGDAGYLHFGPYVPMRPGLYKLLVRGRASSASSAWVDVVSRKGRVEHGKFALTPDDGGLLAQGLFELQSEVGDLEIRVYVGETDEVILSGYELKLVSKRLSVPGIDGL